MSKILIVDDEPNIVMALEYAFQRNGHEVFIARDGTEALDLIDRESIEAMVLDIMMPQVDGYETIRRVKNNPDYTDIKIIFLSAKSKDGDVQKGLALGADQYFTKPFSVKKLIAAVESLLR